MRASTLVRRMLVLMLGAGFLAACASTEPTVVTDRPFDPNDPWAAHIAEASERFDVPEAWIREVMWVESRGETHLNGGLTTSHAGAMGLMQIMPGTWDHLARQHGLGNDPHDPRENIIAGTAYIREMYDMFGSPGFLAAYNAGPGRYQQYLDGERGLPGETQRYMAMISPRISGHQPTGDGPRPTPVGRTVLASASSSTWPPPSVTAASTSTQGPSVSSGAVVAGSINTGRPSWIGANGVPVAPTGVGMAANDADVEYISPTDFGLTPVAYGGGTPAPVVQPAIVSTGLSTAVPPAPRPRGFSSSPGALMEPVYDWSSPGAGPSWTPPIPQRRPWAATAIRPVDHGDSQARLPLNQVSGQAG